MIRLLRWLIWGDGHLCKWTPYGKKTAVHWEEFGKIDETPMHIQQSFQCETCGNVRIFRI